MSQEKAALYIRVSTQYQISGDSLNTQKETLMKYAEMVLGIHDITIFEDAGFSGKNTSRPSYQKMMKELRQEEYTHLLVWKIDRISRNLLDFADLYQELKRLRISFISFNEQFDTSTAIGEAMLKIILVFAELERNMTAERVRANMIARAQKGIWNGGKVPLGYQWDKKAGEFKIQALEIPTVRLIFNLYEEYRSCLIVARSLNQRNILTKEGKAWSPTTVYIILTNPFYIGTFRYNHTSASTGQNSEDDWVIIKDHHEAAIEKKQFEHCQELLQQQNSKSNIRTYTKKHIHIFAGLLYCDYCGEMMTAQPGKLLKKSGHQSSRFACRNRRNASCPNSFTSDTTVGPAIFSILIETARLYLSDETLYSLQDFSEELNRRISLSAQIDLDGLKELWNDYCSHKKNKDSTIYTPLKELHDLWVEFETSHSSLSTSYVSFLKETDRWRVKKLLGSIIAKVHIKDGKIRKIDYKKAGHISK